MKSQQIEGTVFCRPISDTQIGIYHHILDEDVRVCQTLTLFKGIPKLVAETELEKKYDIFCTCLNGHYEKAWEICGNCSKLSCP